MRKCRLALLVVLFLAPAFCVVGYSLRCLGCMGGVEVMRYLFERNATRAEIIKAAVFVCKHFADRDSYICQGITSEFQPTFLYVLEQLLLRPSQLCGLLISDCGTPHNPFDSGWNIPLPPKPPPKWRNRTYGDGDSDERRSVLRVLQLSDLHLDFKYKPGSEAACGLDLCCQGQVREGWEERGITQPAGYWGSLAYCDLPYWTIENLFRHLNQTHEIDYVLLSGDYMSHSDWTYTREDHLTVVSNLTALFNVYLPSTPVYWAVGNHEGVPVNSFAPHFAPKEFWPEWIYKAISDAEDRWLPRRALNQTIYVMLTERLKLISLNTGYCETTNFFLYINQSDPDRTMSWLVEELYQAELADVSVHIMAHVPPGDKECLEGWARNYYRVVNRFEETIKAQFFGHVHVDGFTVFYDDMNDYRSRPTSVLYASPSVTTYAFLNPAYRVYSIAGDYDGSTHEVLDFDTFYLNLSSTRDEEVPKWKKLYSARETYGLSSLNASSWHSLSEAIRSDDAVYEKFLRNYVRRDDYPCDANCRRELLCSLRRGHHNDSALCQARTTDGYMTPASGSMSSTLLRFKNNSHSEGALSAEEFNAEARRVLVRKLRDWLGLG